MYMMISMHHHACTCTRILMPLKQGVHMWPRMEMELPLWIAMTCRYWVALCSPGACTRCQPPVPGSHADHNHAEFSIATQTGIKLPVTTKPDRLYICMIKLLIIYHNDLFCRHFNLNLVQVHFCRCSVSKSACMYRFF